MAMRRSEFDLEPFEAVEVVAVGVLGLFRQAEVGEAGEEDREGDLHFQAGQGGADAEVDAAAEADVGLVLAVGVEFVGVGEAAWVAVGGAEELADDVAGFQLDAVELERFEDVAGEHVEGGVVAEDFFDGGVGEGFVAEGG